MRVPSPARFTFSPAGLNLTSSLVRSALRPVLRAREVLDDGDKARFYALVWPHAPALTRTARFLIRDAAEAEDVVQETLLKAYRSLGSFRDGTDVQAWLMTILRNTRVDHIRRLNSTAGRSVSLHAIPVEPAAADPQPPEWMAEVGDPEEILQQFSDRHLIDALHRLPEEIRWTLLLVDVNGMDHQDAAHVMNVPAGTVKSRAFRGRAMLRAELKPYVKELGIKG